MKFQLGKGGITEGTVASLQLAFKNHSVVRISVLRSLAGTKDDVRALADELVAKLGGHYRSIIIGFTIILKKRGPQPK